MTIATFGMESQLLPTPGYGAEFAATLCLHGSDGPTLEITGDDEPTFSVTASDEAC